MGFLIASKKDREANRYYLLPGMGRTNRQRHRQVLWWAIVAGVIFSAIFGGLIYYMNQ